MFSPTAIFPSGYGADRSPFELDFSFIDGFTAEAEFVVVNGAVCGFGIFGFVPPDVQLKKGGTVKEDSLVYFEKCQ